MNAEIRGSGTAWAVMVGGKQVGRTYSNISNATTAAYNLEIKMRTKTRPCIRCDQTFTSQGRWHRMCPACVQFAAGAMV